MRNQFYNVDNFWKITYINIYCFDIQVYVHFDIVYLLSNFNSMNY